MRYYITDNKSEAVALKDIPTIEYSEFYADLDAKLSESRYHIGHYFALAERDEQLRFYMLLLDDEEGKVLIYSHTMSYYEEGELPSLTCHHPEAHPFEREIWERWGVKFSDMPWLKPLRFPFDQFNRESSMDNYPFYAIEGESLHEVNVGPIHAGIIEPGAFRFICNGEKVLHLEIALGYQHRGVEAEFLREQNRLRQVILAESVAGDSAVAHSWAFTEALEKASVKGKTLSKLDIERTIALELERMAMQIADTGALSMDVAYQLGQVACEALRTVIINTSQAWCGNRFGKNMIRPAGTNFPLTEKKIKTIVDNVSDVRRRYIEVVEDIKSSPSLLARFEQCGVVPKSLMTKIGGVGQAARASGLARDTRATHPWVDSYKQVEHKSFTSEDGDVMSRLMVRMEEVVQSADHILALLKDFKPTTYPAPDYELQLKGEVLSFGLVEGWRGECCHVVITDPKGDIAAVKVKEPSLHNWMALALALRGEGISDFPINNKSFNLSYCGHDL